MRLASLLVLPIGGALIAAALLFLCSIGIGWHLDTLISTATARARRRLL